MKGQLRGLAGPLVKLVAFAVVTVLAAYVLISTITNAGYGEQLTYRAEFSDVAGLVEGDEVRIAGVRVGQITGIGLAEETDRPSAVVEFEVSADVPLPADVEALIRYRNLVGQRYIALTEGEGGGGETLDEGGLIPLAQTTPALDLTVLFGGFQPLLQALTPADTNRLSYEIIQVFQGEGGTVESLLSHVASLTDSLADKDAVIGSVIDNLTTVMGTVSDATSSCRTSSSTCSSSSPGWPRTARRSSTRCSRSTSSRWRPAASWTTRGPRWPPTSRPSATSRRTSPRTATRSRSSSSWRRPRST
jgi:virulence factor Mce-like protein